MAGKQRTGAKTRKRPLTYFYLNGNLYRKLHINRGLDEITAWCYPLEQRVTYPYTQTLRRMEPAFTTLEACAMLNRKRNTVEIDIMNGRITPPQHTYTLRGGEPQRKRRYMWHEKDILAAHAYYSTVHVGRARKDGLITPKRLPTERELRAMIRQEQVFYVKDGDGEFRPTWEAPEF